MDSVILGTIGKIEHCATLSTYSIESDLKKNVHCIIGKYCPNQLICYIIYAGADLPLTLNLGM